MKQHIQLLILLVGFASCQTTYTERGNSSWYVQTNTQDQKNIKSEKQLIEISESTLQITNEEEPQLVNNESPSLKTDFKKDYAPVKNEVINLFKALEKTNNHLSLPQKISVVKSFEKQFQQQFIHYSGYNNAMEYGFKAFIYGLMLFISVIVLFYLITGGGTTNIVIGLLTGLLGAISIVASIGGLLLWFGGWIAYLLGYF
ncbi:MAG: hypothetical protein NBV77_00215 [Bacteroidia bacterium]|nr:hypothetical protein [Bacteroidia bacterium]